MFARSRRPSTVLLLLLLLLLAVTFGLAPACAANDDTEAGPSGDGAAVADGSEDPDPTTSDAGRTGDQSDEGGDASGENATTDSGDSEGSDGTDATELFPDVIGATAELGADGTWTFSATLSSPYDSPERYADAWRVVGPDGTVYGVRELTHDHANEQPFTRSQSGIEIPDDVETVTVEGRDQVSGWGGATVEVALER